ncbi:MAG TPA: Gfo/Idh/MocA family oxidoreductase, partial [Acidimicrobiales bacterium]
STTVFPGLPERLEVSGTGGTLVVENGRLIMRELVAERGEVGSYGQKAKAGAEASERTGAADPAAISQSAHASQFADFLAAIEEGRQPLVTGQEGRNALEVVCAVYESSRRNETVTLPLPAD